MKALISVILLLIIGLNIFCKRHDANKISPTPANIDTTLNYFLDVDYDSIPDKLSFNFQSPSINSPFIWSFEIISKNKTIYRIVRNDKKLDAFFSDTLYVMGCDNYIECKKKFYYKDLPHMVFERTVIPKRIDYIYFETVVKPFLTDSLDLNPNLLKQVLDEFKSRIETGKIIIIPIIISPVKMDHPITYSTTLKRIVPLQRD
jgi:hypothetical protein